MTTQLEFDPDKGYATGIDGRVATREDYLALPVVAWCTEHIGPIRWPKSANEAVCGVGWSVAVDWSNASRQDPPKCYIITDDELDPRLVTKFWMRFT